RGRAMAGVNGNPSARIFCQKIEAELLAIDGYYQTAEELDASLRNRPAQAWQKVVVVDFDVGLRNLDLVMGAERRVVFDLINVVQGVARLSQALIRDKRLETLWLLPASQTRDKDALSEEDVGTIIAELRKTYDWILC